MKSRQRIIDLLKSTVTANRKFRCQPSRKNYTTLASQIKALHELDNDDALAITEDPAAWNELDQETKAFFAGANPCVILALLANDTLSNFDEKLLSKLVTSYTINVSMLHSGFKNPANENDRQQICLMLAITPAITEKINPAAKILLFAEVKKSQLHQREGIDSAIASIIDKAYDIRTDYNPENETWNKYLWPAIAGGFGVGDYAGRVDELISTALKPMSIFESPDESCACAEVLITHPKLSAILTEKFIRENSSDQSACKLRLALGMHHLRIAALLSENATHRGVKGELTLRDLDSFRSQRLSALEKRVTLLERELAEQRARYLSTTNRTAPTSTTPSPRSTSQNHSVTLAITSQSNGRYHSHTNEANHISEERQSAAMRCS